MNHVKSFKGWPPGDAPSKLVQLWYKMFPPHQRGQVEIKKPTKLSAKTSTAWSCAEDQILENKNLRNMILNICIERYVKYFFEIYLPVREHKWLIGSGGLLAMVQPIRKKKSHWVWHFWKLKAQSSNVSFATFQWNKTFELWALSFETEFEKVTPSGIGCTYMWTLSNLSNRHFEVSTIWQNDDFNLSNWIFSLGLINKVIFGRFIDLTKRHSQSDKLNLFNWPHWKIHTAKFQQWNTKKSFNLSNRKCGICQLDKLTILSFNDLTKGNIQSSKLTIVNLTSTNSMEAAPAGVRHQPSRLHHNARVLAQLTNSPSLALLFLYFLVFVPA